MTSEARQRLSDDHRAVNEVLEQLLTALEKKDVRTSYSKLDLFWARLAVHIRAEHLHLFPALINRLSHDASGAQAVVKNLRADHDFFMRELARGIGILRELPQPFDRAVNEASLTSVLEIVLSVKTRLENHNEIEENQVYRWTNLLLTKPEKIDLAARIRRELENRPSRFSEQSWK